MNKYYPKADAVRAENLHGYGSLPSRQNFKRIWQNFNRNISQTAQPKSGRRLTPRRLGLAAACLCLLLTVSITALAMTGFFNLREHYGSIFNNDALADYILTGDALSGPVTDNGIEIQPLGVFIEEIYAENTVAYVRLKITDLEGGRLSFPLSVKRDRDPTPDTMYGPSVESFDGDSAVVVVMATTDEVDANGKIFVNYDAVYAGSVPIEEQSLGITVGDLFDLEEPLNLPGLEFLELLGAEITEYGCIEITRRTAIGDLGLKAPDGTVVWSGSSSYYVTQTDQFALEELGSAFDPADYTLVIKGDRPERVISGNWTIAFDNHRTVAPRTLTAQTADGQTLTIDFRPTRAYVTLSPGCPPDSAEYKQFRDNILPPNKEKPPLIITFKDGATLPLVSEFVAQPDARRKDWTLETTFITPLIVPDDIEYVTFMGEEFPFLFDSSETALIH